MTNDDKVKITRELSEHYDDGLDFQEALGELHIVIGTPEYKFAKDLWDTWDSENG